MSFKICAALFVALLAVQVSTQSPIEDNNISQIIVRISNDVLKVFNSTLNNAANLVDDVEKNQVQITKDIINNVVTIGKTINAEILRLINNLNDGATDNGKAVIACVNAEQNKTEAAFAEVSTIVGQCAANQITVILNKVRVILSQLDLLDADLQRVVDDLSDCSNSDLTCVTKFLGEAIEVAKKIPGYIKDDIEDVIELAKTIIEDMSQCPISSTILKKTQEIFNEGVVCVVKC